MIETTREKYDYAYYLYRKIYSLDERDGDYDEIDFYESCLDELPRQIVVNARDSYLNRGQHDPLSQPLVVRQIRRKHEPLYNIKPERMYKQT